MGAAQRPQVHAARPLGVNEVLLCDRFDDFTPKVLAAMADYVKYAGGDQRRALPDWLAVRETPPYGLGVVVRRNYTPTFATPGYFNPIGRYTGPTLSEDEANRQPDNEYLLRTQDDRGQSIIINGQSVELGASWPRWINKCNERSEENVRFERGGVVFPTRYHYIVGEELLVVYGGSFEPPATLVFDTFRWPTADNGGADVVRRGELDAIFSRAREGERFWRDDEQFANQASIRRRLLPFLDLLVYTVGTAAAKGIFLTMVNVSALLGENDEWQSALPLIRFGVSGASQLPVVVTISQATDSARSVLLCLSQPTLERARADYEFAALRDLFNIQHERSGNQLFVDVDTTRFPHHYFGLSRHGNARPQRVNPFGRPATAARYAATLQRAVLPHWSSPTPRLHAEFAAVLDDYRAMPKQPFEYRASMPVRGGGDALIDEVQAVGFTLSGVAFVQLYTELTGGEQRDELLYVALVASAEYVGIVTSLYAKYSKWLLNRGYTRVRTQSATGFIGQLAQTYDGRIKFLVRPQS